MITFLSLQLGLDTINLNQSYIIKLILKYKLSIDIFNTHNQTRGTILTFLLLAIIFIKGNHITYMVKKKKVY